MNEHVTDEIAGRAVCPVHGSAEEFISPFVGYVKESGCACPMRAARPLSAFTEAFPAIDDIELIVVSTLMFCDGDLNTVGPLRRAAESIARQIRTHLAEQGNRPVLEEGQ